MTQEELVLKMAAIEERGKSNTHRLDEVEERLDDMHRLVVSMEVMAVEQKHIAENITRMQGTVETLSNKIETIEQKPAKKWEGLVEKVVWALVAAAITFILAKVGLS